MKIYLDSRKVIKGPTMILSNYKNDRLKIKQGYNHEENKYFLLITDEKSKITFRVHLTEEEYHNLWNDASNIAKIHDEKDYLKEAGKPFHFKDESWYSIP